MSRLSIPVRLILLCALLLALLVASNAFFTRQLSLDAAAIRQEAASIETIRLANAASKAFGDLKFWLTDLALSLLQRSETQAVAAKEELEGHLEALRPVDPDAVAAIERELAALMEQSLEAVDAYTEGQRVMGNALMARGREHIRAVDELLGGLVSRLQAQAAAHRGVVIEGADRMVGISVGLVLVAALLGLSFTVAVLRSITLPLRRLVSAMARISAGELDAPVPKPGHDEIGAMARTLALFRDSQLERRRLEAAREAAERERERAHRRLSDAIETSSDGFALYDASDRLVAFNGRYREMYGKLDVTIEIGTHYLDIIKGALSKGLIKTAVGREEAWLDERLARHRQPAGSYEQERTDGRWLRVSERKTQEGGTVAVFTDITELKRREAQLNELVDNLAKARDEALQATRAKSQFLANMSHELRTPLNAVIGITEMLREDAEEFGNQDFLEPLDRIHRAGRHLLSLINDILDLSKIESGRLDLHVERFDLALLVADAVETTQPLAAANHNRLLSVFDNAVGAMQGDATRVRQIVLNLLSNACKFTEQGEVRIEVAAEPREGADGYRILVSDTGIGMTGEQLGRLFQEFMQADSSTTRKYGGTGLGLAISKRLVHLMGGDIGVESRHGEGTRFAVWLPRTIGGAVDRAAEPDAGAAASARAAESPQSAARTPTVLVIDDDEDARNMMRRFLAREGFDVVTASGGEEGMELARKLHPDLITLDVIMPRVDGWKVLTILQSDPELAEIPIVMVTIVDERRKGYTLGASEYVTKPVDRDRLTAVLDKYRRSRSEHHVLLVDDDADARQMMRRMLVGAGWHVSEAADGLQALQMLEQASPNLIILDLLMPEMDGFEFLAEFRKRPAHRTVPVVVVTAADLSEAEHQRLNGGVEKVLSKAAYSAEALLEELRRAILRLTGMTAGRQGAE